MSGIIVVFPKIEDAKSIRNLLVRKGFTVTAACTTGAQVLNYADDMGEGIVVSGYRLGDMMYSQLRECLPSQFAMLLLASRRALAQKEPDNVVCVAMPLKVHELIDTINMMQGTMGRRRKKKERSKERDPREKAIIEQAKRLLMERNNMSEEEAHRYVQKCSMDSGTNMVETAEMIMSIMDA